MRQLVFLASADRDLLGIYDYIAQASGSAVTARQFTATLRAQCLKLS